MTDEPEVVDAEPVDEPRRAIVPATPTLTVVPAVPAQELVNRLAVIRETQEKAMLRDVDYGVIPGTDKPALLKPGAEKLSVLFQLDVQLDNEKQWGPGDHLTVLSKATVYHAPTGARLGYGEGLCTSREKKYGRRRQDRTCPNCGKAAVIKGKAEYGGGWLCFKRKDGCGAKWPDGASEIESQPSGEVENPDLPDTWNTVVKMAEKRARVDAVLAVTGASALFTQDVEDVQPAAAEQQEPPPPWTLEASKERKTDALDALAFLLDGDRDLAKEGLKACKEALGLVPDGVVSALSRIAGSVQRAKAARSDVPPAEPGEFRHEHEPQTLADAVESGDVPTEKAA